MANSQLTCPWRFQNHSRTQKQDVNLHLEKHPRTREVRVGKQRAKDTQATQLPDALLATNGGTLAPWLSQVQAYRRILRPPAASRPPPHDQEERTLQRGERECAVATAEIARPQLGTCGLCWAPVYFDSAPADACALDTTEPVGVAEAPPCTNH